MGRLELLSFEEAATIFKIFPCLSSLSHILLQKKTYQIILILRKVCIINLFNIKSGLVEIPLIRNEVMSLAMNHVH